MENNDRNAHTGYLFFKDCKVMTDGQNFFDQPVKNDLRTYNKIWKFATGQGDDYTTGCLLFQRAL